MRRPLFGELLGRFVRLSGHDVSEILEEQFVTPRRFGQIALAYGLCKPQDIWKAWWEQLSEPPPRVDLEAIGIDSQSLNSIAPGVAREFGVIPLRVMGTQIVLATSEEVLAIAAKQLPDQLKMQIKFVLADAAQIAAAIDKAYPAIVKPSAAA